MISATERSGALGKNAEVFRCAQNDKQEQLQRQEQKAKAKTTATATENSHKSKSNCGFI